MVFLDASISLCKALLISRIYPGSDWTWNYREKDGAITFLFYGQCWAFLLSCICYTPFPPRLHTSCMSFRGNQERVLPGGQAGVARSLIMPNHGQERSMDWVKLVQEFGPIHHPQCQLTILEWHPQIESFQVGCQIPCILAAGSTSCSPHVWNN